MFRISGNKERCLFEKINSTIIMFINIYYNNNFDTIYLDFLVIKYSLQFAIIWIIIIYFILYS